MKKKILITIGVIFGLFLITAIALPFVIDVDKFRPQIVQKVNERINGEFKLGKLELSILTGIKVRIESLSLKVAGASKPMVETNSAYVEIPFLSLLAFSPSATVVLNQPKLDVIKGKDGKLNAMKIIKPSTETPAEQKPAQPDGGEASSGMPGIVANASLGFRIENGLVAYTDEVTTSKYLLDGVELDAQNIGLNDTMDVKLRLPLKGSSPTMKLDGVVLVDAEIKPILVGSEVRSATGEIEVDATELSFNLNNGMIKKDGKTTLKFEAEFDGSETDVKIKEMDVKIADFTMGAKGSVQVQPQIVVAMDFSTSQLKLGSLQEFVPMLKEYQLGGVAALQASANGPTDNLAIKGNMTVKDGKAAYPSMLKAPIGFDLKADFSDKDLKLANFSVNGPGTDVKLTGSVANFSSPQFNFALTGKEIDLDKLMKSSDKPTEKSDNAKAGKKETAAAEGAKTNPMAPLAKNPMIASANGVFTAKINKVVMKGAPITDINAKATLKNMVLNVEDASLKAFEGVTTAKFNADLKSLGLGFSTSGTVQSLNMQNACATFVPKFKNTIEGKVQAKWNISGAAFPSSALMKSLKGSMSINSENGKLKTMDIAESIKGSLAKVSFLKGVNIPNIDDGYKTMRAEIRFNDGTIDAQPLELVGSKRGFDIKGKSKIFENMTQDTYVDVFDPNNLLPKEISGGKDASLQLHITGPLSSPQTDYGYTVGRLAKNAAKNAAKEQGVKLIEKALGGKGGNGGGALGDALKKLGF